MCTEAAQILGDVIIGEMQDSMLLIPKIISFASNNYDSSEIFVSPYNKSLASKQTQLFSTPFTFVRQVRQQGQRNPSRAAWDKSKPNPALT